MSELAGFEAAQAKEWGQFVASETIFIGGARAFNVGDPVPASHVTRGVVDATQVSKTNTDATAPAAAVKVAPAATEKG